MKSKSFLTFIFSLTILFTKVDAQAPVEAAWKQSIKIYLNSINKSNALRIDKLGNCYVLGTTWFADSTKDILLMKYNPLGDLEWQRTYDNPSHGDDIPFNMCLDNEGNIWICGLAKNKSNNADFLVLKFSPDGIPVSDEMYDDKNHLYDCANAIEADRFGNVYACGYETTPDSGINILVVKCKPDGSFTWQRKYSTRQMDVANQLILDDSSNVYVCGTINNGPHTADIIVLKYDSDGRKKWQFVYDGVLSQSDAGQFISIDDSTNIYVSGFINHSNNRADIPVLKLNRNGVLLQENFYNGHISDCGAVNLNAIHNSVYLTGGCNDYNISVISSFIVNLDKGGKARYTLNAPEDIQFMKCMEVNGVPVIFGAKTTHPESTLIPFFSGTDSSSLAWTYADSTVYGLAHITNVEVKDNNIYFLGDDTGDATGTIYVFKYIIDPGEKIELKKRTTKKNK